MKGEETRAHCYITEYCLATPTRGITRKAWFYTQKYLPDALRLEHRHSTKSVSSPPHSLRMSLRIFFTFFIFLFTCKYADNYLYTARFLLKRSYPPLNQLNAHFYGKVQQKKVTQIVASLFILRWMNIIHRSRRNESCRLLHRDCAGGRALSLTS